MHMTTVIITLKREDLSRFKTAAIMKNIESTLSLDALGILDHAEKRRQMLPWLIDEAKQRLRCTD